jgi:UDP-N-acetylmuramate dehydrogenase
MQARYFATLKAIMRRALSKHVGLKGHRVGGAMISPKHANFIVNCGGASAADVESLLNTARDAVRQKFSIALEIEVRIVGDAARAAA